jgi:hypothetical protein
MLCASLGLPVAGALLTSSFELLVEDEGDDMLELPLVPLLVSAWPLPWTVAPKCELFCAGAVSPASGFTCACAAPAQTSADRPTIVAFKLSFTDIAASLGPGMLRLRSNGARPLTLERTRVWARLYTSLDVSERAGPV